MGDVLVNKQNRNNVTILQVNIYRSKVYLAILNLKSKNFHDELGLRHSYEDKLI